MSPGTLRPLSARRSLSIFLAGTMGLAFWQVWLTWRLLEQDRNLESQRFRDRLNQTADLAVAQLERSLGGWDLVLSGLKALPPPSSASAKLPDGSILILLSPGGVQIYPPRPLLFVPDLPAASAPAVRLFEAADALELREQRYDRAIAFLQPLANDPAARPEALVRIARIQRKARPR